MFVRYQKSNLESCEEMQPIIIVDDDEEDGCVVVAQEDHVDQVELNFLSFS